MRAYVPRSNVIAENFLCGEQAIEGSRESCIHGHLHDGLDYLVAANTHIKSRGNMDLKLRRCIP